MINMKGSFPMDMNLSFLSFINSVWDPKNVRSFLH
jgi:hypothetical protein